MKVFPTILTMVLLCGGVAAQGALPMTSPKVIEMTEALENAKGTAARITQVMNDNLSGVPIIEVVTMDDEFVALRADGSIVAMSIDGSVTALGSVNLKVRGTSFDYVVPEDPAYTVHQDCANMSLVQCIKRFRAAIKALRGALGLR